MLVNYLHKIELDQDSLTKHVAFAIQCDSKHCSNKILSTKLDFTTSIKIQDWEIQYGRNFICNECLEKEAERYD